MSLGQRSGVGRRAAEKIRRAVFQTTDADTQARKTALMADSRAFKVSRSLIETHELRLADTDATTRIDPCRNYHVKLWPDWGPCQSEKSDLLTVVIFIIGIVHYGLVIPKGHDMILRTLGARVAMSPTPQVIGSWLINTTQT